MSPQQLTPPCPKCHRCDGVEEDEQSGSSAQWFVCSRCGTLYGAAETAVIVCLS